MLYFEIYGTLSILQIGEEKSTVIGLMRKAISQQFTDEVSKRKQFLASFLHVHCIMYLYLRDTECCRASVASKQQHNQNIIRIYKRGFKFWNSSFLPEGIAFDQSALHHFLPECITPRTTQGGLLSFSTWIPMTEKLVVMFCSDLPVKQCEGECC